MSKRLQMARISCLGLLALLGAIICWAQDGETTAAENKMAEAFLADIAAKASVAEQSETMALAGKEGWLFFTPELRSLSAGPFWGEAAIKVSKSTKPEDADPLPAILDFKAQLDKAGIELIMAPVPAKAAIYPEFISETVTGSQEQAPERIDIHQRAFYDLLEKNNITVLDLTPIFLQHRFDKEGFLFCRQDTHWSGRACALTAQSIVEKIKDRAWMNDVTKHTYETQEQLTEITGDLWGMLNDTKVAKEKLPLTLVKERTADGLISPEVDASSPIILLGDSHNLVFHAGDDMLAQDAGLADQLALQLGFPVDLVAVRGSGATPARMTLARSARKPGYLTGKKLLIWCFTAREFTEGAQGWRKIPVIK